MDDKRLEELLRQAFAKEEATYEHFKTMTEAARVNVVADLDRHIQNYKFEVDFSEIARALRERRSNDVAQYIQMEPFQRMEYFPTAVAVFSKGNYGLKVLLRQDNQLIMAVAIRDPVTGFLAGGGRSFLNDRAVLQLRDQQGKIKTFSIGTLINSVWTNYTEVGPQTYAVSLQIKEGA